MIASPKKVSLIIICTIIKRNVQIFFRKVKKLAGDDGPSMIVSSIKYINSSYEIKQKYQHSITISEENLKFEM